MQLTSILPASIEFSGNDFRTNLFALYQSKTVQIQAEYLRASLNDKITDGYYVLTTLNLKKNQLVASWNKYNDLIESTANSPIAHMGYDYLLNQDKLKIMLDNGVQISNGSLKNHTVVAQLQLFFN